MSEQDNIQTVQQAYAAFGSKDIPRLLGLLDDNIDWQPIIGASAAVPTSGRRQGRAAVAGFFQQLSESIEFDAFEPKEFFGNGDKVVVLGSYRGRARHNNRAFANDWVMVFTVRDGKAVAFREYLDPTSLNAAFA